MAQQHVLVVGAGVIGASMAFHLVRAGARVTIVDAAEPGGVASPCSFGWTNASYRNPRHYFDLRVRSMALWDELAAELPGVPYRQSGVLYLDTRDYTLEEFYENHTAWGYHLRWVKAAEVQAMEPSLNTVPDVGIFAPKEGAVDPDLAAKFLVEAAVGIGAKLISGRAVTELATSGGRVVGVVSDGETLDADVVVLAAGVGTEALAASAGVAVPMQSSAGLLVHTKPVPAMVGHVILADGVHFRQRIDGRFVGGEDFAGRSLMDDPVEGATVLFERLKEHVRGSDGFEMGGYTLGFRPMPVDEHPAIGRPSGVDGLYITVMHSGATLAPAVGRFATDDILTGKRDPLIEPFGVDRFADA